MLQYLFFQSSFFIFDDSLFPLLRFKSVEGRIDEEAAGLKRGTAESCSIAVVIFPGLAVPAVQAVAL